MKIFAPIAIATALLACSDPNERPSTDAAETNAANETVPAKLAIEPDQTVPKSADGQTAPAPLYTTDYTSLKTAKCVTVELDEEAAGYIREQCGAFKGVPLFRVEGDLRQSAYAGNQPSGQTTISPFNYLTDMVEWRMHSGKPIALIYRLKADAPDMPGNGKTQLFVQKIGVGEAPSCIIGVIAGNVPDANVKAREIADTAAAVTCSDGQSPKILGDTM